MSGPRHPVSTFEPTVRRAVLARLAVEPDLQEDLQDLGLVARRRDGPSRPLRDCLAEKGS